MAIVQSVPSEEDCNELGLVASKCSAQANPFKITGYISKPDHGMGRSSADRQFLYVNKRPCELSKVSRVINEVYHMFNRHQYPFVMIDISLARGLFVVCCSPSSYVSVITCPHIAQYREPYYSYAVSYNLGCIWCMLLAEYVPTFQKIILDSSS